MPVADDIARMRAQADELEALAARAAAKPTDGSYDLATVAEQIAQEVAGKNWTEQAAQLFAEFLPQLVYALQAASAQHVEDQHLVPLSAAQGALGLPERSSIEVSRGGA